MVDVIGLGEAIIDFIALDNVSLRDATRFMKSFGGAPMNTLIGVSRLGFSSGAITAVGEDPFGEYIVKILRENCVDTSNVQVKRGFRTPLAFITNEPNTGERRFLFYRNPHLSSTADTHLSIEDMDFNYLRNAKVLHVSGFSLSYNTTRETVLKAVKFARENGVRVFFDPTLRPEVWDSEEEIRKVTYTILKECDIASFSTEEAEFFFGTTDYEKAASLALNFGLKIVCIKLGSKGAFSMTVDGVSVLEPAFKVKAVDTTGAGDGWNAGFIVGMLKNFGLRDSVRIANALGALVVTKHGAITALPYKGELNRFLEYNGLNLRI
ncbi:MAG: sugar kinase [Nitrososphaeria archaeon]|nr:sugar kinase [Nitrososphaeria archaeon]